MDRRLGSHRGEMVMYNTNRELLPSLVQRKLEKGRPGDKLVTVHRENGQAAGREVLRLYLIAVQLENSSCISRGPRILETLAEPRTEPGRIEIRPGDALLGSPAQTHCPFS